MTRLLTHGNEPGDTPTPSINNSVVTVSSPINSGTQAFDFSGGTAANYATWTITNTTFGVAYFLRAYVRVGSSPSALMRLLEVITTGSLLFGIRLSTSRTLQLLDINGIQVGSSSAVLAVDTWHVVELGFTVNSTGQGQLGMRLNGTQVVALTAADVGNVAINRVRLGRSPALTITGHYGDDVALNDNVGAAPDNTWPGSVSGGGGTVTLTFIAPTPAAAATISGIVNIEVDASDDGLLDWVSFQINSIQQEIRALPPWTWAFDTTTQPNGAVTIEALGRQTDGTPVSITRSYTVNNVLTPAPSVTKVRVAGVWQTKAMKHRVGGVWTAKPYKAISGEAPPPPGGSVVAQWVSPSSGAIVSGTTVPVAVTTSDDSRVDRIEFHKVAGNVLLFTEELEPWAHDWDVSGLPNGSMTLRATVIHTDASPNTVITRDVTVDNTVAPPPPLSGTYRQRPWGGHTNNDQALRNGVARGSGTTQNFVPGSIGWVYACRFVPDFDLTLDRFWFNMKARGCSWWSPTSDTGATYGDGTGGIINVRLCNVDSSGNPRFTDSAAMLGEELGIDPQTRYDSVRQSSVLGFTWNFGPSGGDGPMSWYFSPRKAGAMAQLSKDTMYAFCVWNSHPQPGLNFMAVNSVVVRQYPFPPTTPGISSWPSALLTGGGGRGRTPHSFNNLDKTMPGAIFGMDPRECAMWSVNGGATFPHVGAAVGFNYYTGGADPSVHGLRMPRYGLEPVGQRVLSPTPLNNQNGTATSWTTPWGADRALTVTHAGGYFNSGTAPGTLTVVQKRGGTTIATATATGFDSSGGIQERPLSVALNMQIGDTLQFSSGGGVVFDDADSNSRIFLNSTTDLPQYHCVPWPFDFYHQGTPP